MAVDVVVAGEQERYASLQSLVAQVLDGGNRLGPLGELGPVGLDELGPGHLSTVKGAAYDDTVLQQLENTLKLAKIVQQASEV